MRSILGIHLGYGKRGKKSCVAPNALGGIELILGGVAIHMSIGGGGHSGVDRIKRFPSKGKISKKQISKKNPKPKVR